MTNLINFDCNVNKHRLTRGQLPTGRSALYKKKGRTSSSALLDDLRHRRLAHRQRSCRILHHVKTSSDFTPQVLDALLQLDSYLKKMTPV